MARSEWVSDDAFGVVLALLTHENALAVETSLRYGLRISDVLSLKTEKVRNGSFTLREQKTGKTRRIRLSDEFRRRLLGVSGRLWVFEHRTDWTRHRTRQAVYKDIRRAATALRLPQNLSPHSARKAYAVRLFRTSGGSLEKVRRLLNHSDEAVTAVYALADQYSQKVHKKRKKNSCAKL